MIVLILEKESVPTARLPNPEKYSLYTNLHCSICRDNRQAGYNCLHPHLDSYSHLIKGHIASDDISDHSTWPS